MPTRPFYRSPGRIALLTAGALFMLLLVLPLVALALHGLESRAWEGLPGMGITEALYLSLVTTALTVLLTALLGTPLAYIMARWRFPLKGLLAILLQLPLVLPPAVAGLALLITFGRRGLFGPALDMLGINLPFSTAAVVIAQTFVSAPFYLQTAQLGFQGIPQEVEEAARVDGAGGFTLFWRITLPLSAQALAAGLVLSWARALGEFGATILFAGSLQGRTQTMPLLVYNILERDLDAAVWTGLLLVGMALAALLLSRWLLRQEKT
ncbi:MAG: molybdate ABC transporter permease subunit [Anaerolineaceae bacterium]|nr:molybdate ABC transporter permease subunit [Anaerolineaceae bacterium]